MKIVNHIINLTTSATLDFIDTDDLAVSGWFYRDLATTDDTILAKRNGIVNTDTGYILYLDDSTDKLTFEVSDGTDEYQLESATTFTATGWNHFEVIWDENSAANSEIYINGKADSATDTGTIVNVGDFTNALTLAIGAESDAGNPFDGLLDDLKIYRYARSAAEVLNDYNRGLAVRLGDAPEYSGNAPVGWWNFDAGSINNQDTTLKGCWNFNEASGSALDCSGNGNTGSITGATRTNINGVLGESSIATNSALSFDGSGDWVDVGSGTTLAPSAVSVSAWIKTTSTAEMFVVSKKGRTHGGWHAYSLYVGSPSAGKVAARIQQSSAPAFIDFNTTTTVHDGNWHYITLTFGTDFIGRIYIDGVLSATSSSGSAIYYHNLTSIAYIGASRYCAAGNDCAADTTESSFVGTIDEVRIYNRALSASEVYSHYLSGRAKDKGVSSSTTLANNNDGQLNGPTWRRASDCKVGKCLEFDGTNDYVNAGDPAGGELDFSTGDFSIAGWALADVDNQGDNIIAKRAATGNGFEILSDATDGSLNFAATSCSNVDAGATLTFNDNVWHHFVVARSGTTVATYLDGLPGATGTCSADLSSTASFYIGAQSDGTNFWDGRIDDVRAFNYALSQKQIMQIYNRAKPVAHYKFDEGAGITAYDESDYNNDGTLTNFPTDGTNWVTGKFGKALALATDDYISAADSNSTSITGSATISAWIYRSTTGTEQTIVGKWDETTAANKKSYRLFLDSSNKLALSLSDDGTDTDSTTTQDTATLTDTGAWHHVEAVYTSGASPSVVLYLDGKTAAATTTGTLPQSIHDNASLLYTGAHQGTSAVGNFWGGRLDDIRLYNYARSAAEVLVDYNGGLAASFGN